MTRRLDRTARVGRFFHALLVMLAVFVVIDGLALLFAHFPIAGAVTIIGVAVLACWILAS
jgi:cytochrome b subunit of formate dehydrogenase